METIMDAAEDYHVHLRNDQRTQPAIAAVRHGGTARVLIMPNTQPPILTGQDAEEYAAYLKREGCDFDLVRCIKITDQADPDRFVRARNNGVIVAKQYPSGVTTNSEDGIHSVEALFPVYEAMQDCDMVLSLHGERPNTFVLDAEEAFLQDLIAIHKNFPKLRVVLEHVSTAAAVTCVSELGSNVTATITDHHLEWTLQDVVGSRIRPHHFCMPIAKRPEDRKALVQVVKDRNPKFFSGTDSAPHFRGDKESACGCAGVFNALSHVPFLATRFEDWGIFDHLEKFTSHLGRDFYQLEPTGESICIKKEPFHVPQDWYGITPFLAGETLAFSVAWE